MTTDQKPRPGYGHAAHLLTLCVCGEGYVSTRMEDNTMLCASCATALLREEGNGN